MSSNMWGFEAEFEWQGRWVQAQIVFNGTDEYDPWSYDRATAGWESEIPADLAK